MLRYFTVIHYKCLCRSFI